MEWSLFDPVPLSKVFPVLEKFWIVTLQPETFQGL